MVGAHEVDGLGDVEVRVGTGALEGLAHTTVDGGGIAPHDVDVVRANPGLGELHASRGVREARIEVVDALDGRIDLLGGREVRGVLRERRGDAHAPDEADAVRLRHEARHDAGKGTRLLEVDLDGLEVVERLIIREIGRGVGVRHEEVHVGVGVGGLGDDLGPVGAELVASGDDEVDVLVDVGLGCRGGIGGGGVLLGLEHLPLGVVLAGLLEGLIVALAPATVERGTGDDEGDLVAVLACGVAGGRAVIGGPTAADERQRGGRGGSAGAKLEDIAATDELLVLHVLPFR